jgi:hypothetical protein
VIGPAKFKEYLGHFPMYWCLNSMFPGKYYFQMTGSKPTGFFMRQHPNGNNSLSKRIVKRPGVLPADPEKVSFVRIMIIVRHFQKQGITGFPIRKGNPCPVWGLISKSLPRLPGSRLKKAPLKAKRIKPQD